MSLRWSISFLHICLGWQEHLIIDEMCVRLNQRDWVRSNAIQGSSTLLMTSVVYRATRFVSMHSASANHLIAGMTSDSLTSVRTNRSNTALGLHHYDTNAQLM